MKITVKIDTKVPQYKASKVTLLGVKGASAETQIMLGKSGVILKSAEAVDKTNWKAEAVVEEKYDTDGNKVKVLTNCITLKANTAVTPGKQTVQVKIVPDGSETKGITVDIPVTVGDVDKTKGKVKISNVNIDLGKANTDGSFVTTGYDTKKKCGVWTVTLPEGTGYSYTVDGIELKAAALGSDKFDYIEAKLDSKKNIVLTVYNTGSIKLGKTVKNVPVDLTFDAGSVSDPVKVNVIVPKSVPDMAGIAADITSYINGKCNQATEAVAINAELGKDKYKKAAEFANVTIGTVVVNQKDADGQEVTEAEDKKNWVHITLTDKADSKNTQKIDIELPEASTDGAQTIDQAYKALEEKVKLIVDAIPKTIPEGMSESDYLVPSNETTVADIRAFLSGVVTNEDVMFSVLDFRIDSKATTEAAGSISFSYRLIGKRGVEAGDGSHFDPDDDRVRVSKTIPQVPKPETAAGN